MSKIRVLSDHIANQIAAGEVVERPSSVAKELVENAIDAGARRLEIDVEAGGRRLLRVADDGEGMTRDDAVLAFERHATSKISRTEDLQRINTLGFRGEALASIASVARVELVTQTEGQEAATRVLIEGGRMRDVGPAARPRGTTITVRELFFNVPARRKFLRSEATESFHLTNLVTHYALAHPEIAFVLTNNGREALRAAPAADVRERAYQIFGAEFLESLLEVAGGDEHLARVRGYVSAPRERRTTRDAQYLFVNGRYVRDRIISRALSEAYRTILPQGVYPAALLFLEVPPEEVDVNVHPAKTEVRFRRASAVGEVVREAVRAALASGGYTREAGNVIGTGDPSSTQAESADEFTGETARDPFAEDNAHDTQGSEPSTPTQYSQTARDAAVEKGFGRTPAPAQEAIEFGFAPTFADQALHLQVDESESGVDGARQHREGATQTSAPETAANRSAGFAASDEDFDFIETTRSAEQTPRTTSPDVATKSETQKGSEPFERAGVGLPPLDSLAGMVREVPAENLSSNIRPLGQFAESYIIASDSEGLLLIDQHAAHERILFDKYHALETSRAAESQNLLMPETFDLTPAQAAVFDLLAPELESYGFGLMRLSGRTVAIRAVPADLPAGEARNMLAEVLNTVDAGRRNSARETLREQIAVALACRAAVKVGTPLTTEKMRWLIDRLLTTSSPTTCPHGRPVVLRLARRDIDKSFRSR